MHIVFFSVLGGAGDLKEAARILHTIPPAKETGAYSAGGYLNLVGFYCYLATVNHDFPAAAYATGMTQAAIPVPNEHDFAPALLFMSSPAIPRMHPKSRRRAYWPRRNSLSNPETSIT